MASPQTQKLREKQRQRTAGFLSLTLVLILLLTLYYIRIYFDTYQPVYEFGQETSFGEDEFGSGSQPVPIEEIISEAQNAADESPKLAEEVLETFEPNDSRDTPLPEPNPEEKEEELEESPQSNQDPSDKKVQSPDAQANNEGQGDDPDKEGDKGKETGINQEGLYEGAGGSGGPSLNVSGWRWSQKPQVDDQSDVTGRIVFEVKVDEFGDFQTVITKSTTIADPVIVNKYKDAVFKSILEPDESGRPAPISQGTVTFVLKAK